MYCLDKCRCYCDHCVPSRPSTQSSGSVSDVSGGGSLVNLPASPSAGSGSEVSDSEASVDSSATSSVGSSVGSALGELRVLPYVFGEYSNFDQTFCY